MPDIRIDNALCTSCGACAALCISSHVYETVDDQTRVINPDACWLCGHCISVCPADAIIHSDFPYTNCPIIQDDSLPSLDNLIAAFSERRSARIFKNRPVPRETIETLVDIARWVPSASNGQPVDWIAIDDPHKIAELCKGTITQLKNEADQIQSSADYNDEDAEDLERCADQHTQGEDPIFYKAPALLLGHVPAEAEFGRDDACYATYNLMLGAERMGLGSCLIGYFIYALDQNPEVGRVLNLAENRRIEVAVILGYPKYKFRRAIPRRKMKIEWL